MRARTIAVLAMVIVIAALLLPGCRRNSGPVPRGTAADTTRSADTSAQSQPQTVPARLTYEQEQGKYVFTKYCAVCHGDDGKGDGFNAYNLNPKPRDFTDEHLMGNLSDERLQETVREGGGAVNKSPLMPAWGGTLSARQIDYVVEYLKTFAAQQ